jgi:putative nucleotidyltransferase with HDIG domain
MPRPCVRLLGIYQEFKDRFWESDRLLRIGRSRSVEVELNDSSVSRQHAEIALCEAGWVVRDLGSTNGTLVNGTRLGRSYHQLGVHDVLQFGNVVVIVQALVGDPRVMCENPPDGLQVQATTEQTWEEAVELLALDVTRRARPGEQMLSLLRAGHHFYQTASLDDLLRVSTRDAVTALNARRGAVILVDEATRKLTVRALYSTRPEQQVRHPFSLTLAQRCLQTGQSLLCSDVRTDLALQEAPSVARGEMNSVICALVRSPRRRLGVLHLDRGISEPSFTPDDLRLADAIAANMSSAVESSQGLEEAQRDLFIQTVITLAQAIELRDDYTGGHTQRVTDYSLLLAEELGLPSADRHSLQIGAPLHDIGKIGISDAVLRKPGQLTAAEFEQMKTHTVKGAVMLGNIPDLESIVPIVRSHHERWDGNGYPDRRGGTNIPRLARLVAVADAFDAMTSDRPYRIGMPPETAFAEIRKGAGKQFDPECAAAFLRAKPRVEQLLHQQDALVDTANMGKLYDVRKLLARAQPA